MNQDRCSECTAHRYPERDRQCVDENQIGTHSSQQQLATGTHVVAMQAQKTRGPRTDFFLRTSERQICTCAPRVRNSWMSGPGVGSATVTLAPDSINA